MDEIVARLHRLPTDVRVCLSFFSRLPLAPAHPAEFDLRVSAGAWPVAGLLVAVIAAAVLVGSRAAGLPPVVAATFAVAALVLLSGALHEDGLADTADGLGGGGSAEQQLRVMRDSRIGAYGALALVLTTLLRVGALAEIAVRPGAAAMALLVAAVLSRSIGLWHWHALPPARADGLARQAGQPDGPALMVGSLFGASAVALALSVFGASALLAIALAAAGATALTSLCRRGIGGHTGDTIGATQQVSEALVLAGLSANWIGPPI